MSFLSSEKKEERREKKQGADSSLDSMVVCWVEKTSNLHLFLLPKSFGYT